MSIIALSLRVVGREPRARPHCIATKRKTVLRPAVGPARSTDNLPFMSSRSPRAVATDYMYSSPVVSRGCSRGLQDFHTGRLGDGRTSYSCDGIRLAQRPERNYDGLVVVLDVDRNCSVEHSEARAKAKLDVTLGSQDGWPADGGRVAVDRVARKGICHGGERSIRRVSASTNRSGGRKCA